MVLLYTFCGLRCARCFLMSVDWLLVPLSVVWCQPSAFCVMLSGSASAFACACARAHNQTICIIARAPICEQYLSSSLFTCTSTFKSTCLCTYDWTFTCVSYLYSCLRVSLYLYVSFHVWLYFQFTSNSTVYYTCYSVFNFEEVRFPQEVL